MAERDVPVVFVEGPPAYYSRLGFAPGALKASASRRCRIPDEAFSGDTTTGVRAVDVRNARLFGHLFGDTLPSAYAIRSSAARRG